MVPFSYFEKEYQFTRKESIVLNALDVNADRLDCVSLQRLFRTN